MTDRLVFGIERIEIKQTVTVGAEFRPPVSDAADAPALGIGAQRANPVTGVPEYWDGSAWVATGTTGIISGSYTTTGNGLAASFTIPVDLSALTPAQLAALDYIITPVTAPAQGMISNEATATGLKVNYDVCPVGTLTYNYKIKLP